MEYRYCMIYCSSQTLFYIGILETTERMPVGTIVAVTRKYVIGIEAQVPRVLRIRLSTRTRRPIVAVLPLFEDSTIAVKAGTCKR